MESDNNAPVTDEQRRLAETKKLTMQPIHAEVEPEPEPDSEVVARHLNEPAIGNMANDTEQTAPLMQPSKGLLGAPQQQAKRSTGAIILAAIVAVVLIVVLTVVILLF